MAYISNKKIRLRYEVLETFEAGIELFGFEVKSVKNGRGSLDGSYVLVRGGQVFLKGANIPPYQSGNTPESYTPTRERRLLLHREEILKLANLGLKKGLTIVPISVYNKRNIIKVEIGIVRGLKSHDKREVLRKRDDMRHIERIVKGGVN